MSRFFNGRLLGAGLGAAIGALIFVVSPAFASNLVFAAGPSGGTTNTTTTTNTALFTTDSPYFIFFLLILFVFGFLLIGSILFYVYKIQIKFYNVTQSLSQMGEEVSAVTVNTFRNGGGAGGDLAAMEEEAPVKPAPPPLNISGPGIVAVGAHAVYTVMDKDKKPVDDANWKIDPVDVANLSPTTGASSTVIPLKVGSFKLTAQRPTAKDMETFVTVAIIAPQSGTENLPFLGQAYGSLVIAVLVVVAVILLAMTGTLTGEAVATLFGGLLGYIFGVTTSAATTSSSSKKTGTQSSGTSSTQ